MRKPFYSHFEARLPLCILTMLLFVFYRLFCDPVTWTQTGWIAVGYLIFVLLTHRLHNRWARVIDDDTEGEESNNDT